MTFDDLEKPQIRPVRFEPDPLDCALIATTNLEEPFTPELVGLIYDEAPLNGCSLVCIDHPNLQVGNGLLVKVGRMDVLAAQVVWKKTLEKRLVQLGLQYLE
jgi:hypothetical protein